MTLADIKVFVARAAPPQGIIQISHVRDFAFVEFESHALAEKVKATLKGQAVKHKPVEIEWARPPDSNSVHEWRSKNFSVELRLKCIANYWNLPIYIYGRVFYETRIQVVGVIIKRQTFTHIYIVEISLAHLNDIHSRVSEVIDTLIRSHGHLPLQHLVLKVSQANVQTAGYMYFYDLPYFVPSILVKEKTKLHIPEIYEVAVFAQKLAKMNSRMLFHLYDTHVGSANPILECSTEIGRTLACINWPQTSGLKYDLDNRHMIFVLCDAVTATNHVFFNKDAEPLPLQNFYPNGTVNKEVYLQPMELIPLKMLNQKHQVEHFKCIIYGSVTPEVMQIQNFLASSQ